MLAAKSTFSSCGGGATHFNAFAFCSVFVAQTTTFFFVGTSVDGAGLPVVCAAEPSGFDFVGTDTHRAFLCYLFLGGRGITDCFRKITYAHPHPNLKRMLHHIVDRMVVCNQLPLLRAVAFLQNIPCGTHKYFLKIWGKAMLKRWLYSMLQCQGN